jgi:muramoyltetrapeptide carboxypeptidase
MKRTPAANFNLQFTIYNSRFAISNDPRVPIKPLHLNYGDTIGIIAPASAPPDPKAIDQSVAVLQRLGFKPKLAPNVRKRWGFLAGSDRDRAGDVMKMFTDRKVNAILCVRGGYGTARLLPLLDYRAIRANPKAFIGYSDITSLHCAFLKKSNLVSFHGPMLNSDFIQKNLPDFTLQSFLRTLMQPTAPGSVGQGYKKKTVSILRRGTASGPLFGGNLSILCASLGTPWQPSFKDVILFFEDLAEVPYRYDRMLTHLLNAGLLQQVAGVAIGINANCHDPNAKKTKEYRQTMEDVARERLLPLKVPVVTGLPFGHIPLNATLPIGIRATLDAVNGDLIVTEPAVQ